MLQRAESTLPNSNEVDHSTNKDTQTDCGILTISDIKVNFSVKSRFALVVDFPFSPLKNGGSDIQKTSSFCHHGLCLIHNIIEQFLFFLIEYVVVYLSEFR